MVCQFDRGVGELLWLYRCVACLFALVENTEEEKLGNN